MRFIITSLYGEAYRHYFCDIESGSAVTEVIPELDPYQGVPVFIPTEDNIFFYIPGTGVLYKASSDFSEIVPFELSGAQLLKGGVFDGTTGNIRIAVLTEDGFSIKNILWSETDPIIISEDISRALALTGIPYAVYFEPYGYRIIVCGSHKSVSVSGSGFTVIPVSGRVRTAGPSDILYVSGDSAVKALSYSSDGASEYLWETAVDHSTDIIVETYDFRLIIPSGSNLKVYDRTTGELDQDLSITIEGDAVGLSCLDIRFPECSISQSDNIVDMGEIAPVTGNDTADTGITVTGCGDTVKVILPEDMYGSVVAGVWNKESFFLDCIDGVPAVLSLHPFVRNPGTGSGTVLLISGRTGRSYSAVLSWKGVWAASAVIPVKITSDVPGLFDKEVVLTAGNSTVRKIRLTGTFI